MRRSIRFRFYFGKAQGRFNGAIARRKCIYVTYNCCMRHHPVSPSRNRIELLKISSKNSETWGVRSTYVYNKKGCQAGVQMARTSGCSDGSHLSQAGWLAPDGSHLSPDGSHLSQAGVQMARTCHKRVFRWLAPVTSGCSDGSHLSDFLEPRTAIFFLDRPNVLEHS
jgi:hypothetical protein